MYAFMCAVGDVVYELAHRPQLPGCWCWAWVELRLAKLGYCLGEAFAWCAGNLLDVAAARDPACVRRFGERAFRLPDSAGQVLRRWKP